ncbi:MAG: DUF3318 domain-containing protein [Cyanobacteria bacterium P01_A01_bin.3]
MGSETSSQPRPQPRPNEVKRLRSLLPPELQSWVDIHITGTYKPELISCVDALGDRIAIELDLAHWQELPREHRDLLFLHQVARIQSDTIPKEGWEKSALLIGLGGAVGEIWVQDTWLLLLSLALASVAGTRLYRKRRNRQIVRDIFSADRKAVVLATQLGYASHAAQLNLILALQDQCNRAQNVELKTQYRARAEALRQQNVAIR